MRFPGRTWLTAAAALTALTTMTTLATPASAAEDPADLSARMAQLAAYPTSPCVAGGPTSADTAAADRLNNVLTGTLRGHMTPYRVSCARAVINAVQANRFDERAAVIAITTTIVESLIENINEKVDHTSLGLFQQQDWWGTEAQRLNPAFATGTFLDHMVTAYPGGSWRTTPIGEVCQKVQGSAFPGRYQPQAVDAQRIVDELGGPTASTTSIYGSLGDGRLTYSTINAQTGDRTKTLVSGDNLGFVPKTLATLNQNTLLVTSPAGELYRVDVITNKNSLQLATPTALGGGWTHSLLAYDGHGHLYGVAGSTLMSYVVSRPKPSSSQIGQRAVIGTGFTLRSLTATGDDWLLGVSTAGTLRSYHIAADYTWTGATLGERWSGIDQVVSPGFGLYYGQTRDGGLYRYFDHNPYDLDGDDLQSFGTDPVDTQGWTQTLLSAQPFAA